MKKLLDIENWARKDHFKFFTKFDEPFWGVTVEIDCTLAYDFCKKHGHSFFLYYLHKSLLAANSIESFRYRISGEQVEVYDAINASPTINREDETFGFGYMEYKNNFTEFTKIAKKEIERIRNTPDLDPTVAGQNVIHYSSLPWLNFTSVSHARSFSFPDSCPKITFGQMTDKNNKKFMPVSIHVHHALIDGIHVGEFMEIYQKLMNETPYTDNQ